MTEKKQPKHEQIRKPHHKPVEEEKSDSLEVRYY